MAHINVRELRAVCLAFQAFSTHLEGKCFSIRTDNTTAMSVYREQGGACSSPLCKEALDLWHFCITHAIHLKASYLSGSQNMLADYLSRSIFTHKWSFYPDVTNNILPRWGIPHRDLFVMKCTEVGVNCGHIPHPVDRAPVASDTSGSQGPPEGQE